MAFDTILIHAESEARLPALLSVADALARRQGAHVSALAVTPAPMRIPAGVPGAAQPIWDDARAKAFTETARRMRATFEAVTRGKAYTADWLSVEAQRSHGEVALAVAHSRLADVVVVGDAGEERGGSRQGLAEHLVLEAGRPVVVVPRIAIDGEVGRRVLVAWNGSREAVRAVHDALPLLKAASQVMVLQAGSDTPAADPALSTAELCRMLKRHGVSAKAENLALPGGAVGAALLAAAKALSADMLVMGAWGHWRFTELILGGATRHVLRHACLPVLMSH